MIQELPDLSHALPFNHVRRVLCRATLPINKQTLTLDDRPGLTHPANRHGRNLNQRPISPIQHTRLAHVRNKLLPHGLSSIRQIRWHRGNTTTTNKDRLCRVLTTRTSLQLIRLRLRTLHVSPHLKVVKPPSNGPYQHQTTKDTPLTNQDAQTRFPIPSKLFDPLHRDSQKTHKKKLAGVTRLGRGLDRGGLVLQELGGMIDTPP